MQKKIRTLRIAIGANILLSALLLMLSKESDNFGIIIICGVFFRICNVCLIIELIMFFKYAMDMIKQLRKKEKD